MKIRQVLKLYNKSKPTLFKIRHWSDSATVISNAGIKFIQNYKTSRKAETLLLRYIKKHPDFRSIIHHFPHWYEYEIRVHTKPNFIDNLPKIGDELPLYNDCKIRISRESFVTVTNIIPFNEISNEIKKGWKESVDECYWLYSDETDYIIDCDGTLFCRTLNGGWYSFYSEMFGGGLLDTTKEYYNDLHNSL